MADKLKPPEFTPDQADWKAVEEWLALLFEAGALDASDFVGDAKLSAVEFAATRAAALLTRGSGTTPLDTLQELVQAKLGEAIEKGSSLREFEVAIEQVLEADGSMRAALIARTEAKNAYNNGAAENYRAQGVKMGEIVDGSGLGDVCDDENGEIVTIDEFIARSDARHPNCTIAMIPVLDGLEGGETE